MRFRRFVSGVALVAAATTMAACGGDSGSAMNEDGNIEVQIGRAPAFPQFPLFVAEEKGFFTEGGLAPEFVGIKSGPEQTAAQVSGQLDIVDNVPNNLLPIIDKGTDLKAFTAVTKASQFDIIVRSDYPITAAQGDWQETMKQLEGAKVGVIARGTGAEDMARTLFQEAGVDPERQTYIATGLPATTMAAMQNGQIDMAMTIEPGITQATQNGLAKAPFSLRDGEGPESLMWPGVIGTVTAEYAEANPDVLNRYVDVMTTTFDWMKDPANRDEVIELLQSSLSVPTDTADALYDNSMDNFADQVPLTDEDISELTTAAQWVKSTGDVSKDYTGEDFTIRVDTAGSEGQ
ncbi:hypothetical protein GIY30_01410 [Gordonia sp. HNM0687]|uniref:SsuA/THI5-like domain-containing protein n=1 Tax=Gordonia mangrovi TaxID=2665643 RepID=A0A6L7GML2_9ACTN|nr:ABC transporter substrate-binding protein [Gordonia mangrovi]MXP20025.1 hypothetical protein [Gordonia mangrovi]UVF79359.1 ABC transporter substrate-binding protein [Gordonia mangrovi]